MSKKSASAVDKHVGSRVRMRRMLIGMSQEKLGEALGITFQQVQKYEKGTNRIGASRLHHIGTVLGVDVEFFFEGLPSVQGGGKEARVPMIQFLALPDSDRLVQSFVRLPDDAARRKVTDLVELLAGSPVQPASKRKSA